MTLELFFEKLQKQYSNGLPFVAYRKPNENLLKAIFQNDDELHYTSDFIENGFVFAPFDNREKAVLIPSSNSNLIEVNCAILSVSDKPYIKNHVSVLGKENHINLVLKGIKAINSGMFKKVVLSRKEELVIGEESPIIIFQRLLNVYASAFTYIWYHPQIGLWLGATPETLLKSTGNSLSTMALAGTQPYVDTMNVFWGAKEQEEQQMVTDYILDNLQPLVKDIRVSPVETVRAGSMLHLRTKISSTFNFQLSNFQQLLKNLHPTPATCGLPRLEAKQFILENEGYDRAFYTGFLGELNMKETFSRNRNRRNVENNAYNSVKTVTNLFVNLRCMQIIGDEASIYVGGGITKDSIPESEWEETINKTNTMRKVL